MHGRIFTSTLQSFDVDSKSLGSLSSYMFTRYLRDKRNNELSIFMLSGFIQFSFHFSLSKSCNVYKTMLLYIFPITNAIQYIYIYIYIHFIYIQLQFIGHFKLCNFICTKSFKSQIMNFSILLSFFPYRI